MVTSGTRPKKLAWLALVALMIAACLPAEVPHLAPSPSAVVQAGPTTQPSPPPTSTWAMPIACPVPLGDPEPIDLSDAATTADAVLGFLNSGGTLDDLMSQVEAAGRLGSQGGAAHALDLNGDGRLDVVIALTDPPGPEGGSVLMLLCQGDRYAFGSPPSLEEADAIPNLHADAELTHDSSADVLLGWRTCGAHTCFERLEVLSASGTQIVRHGLEPSADLAYPEVTIGAGGSVVVTATGIGSVGAGPFRRFTRTWAWDPSDQAFALVSDEREPPRYRIHALLDADAAALLGDLQAALDLYHRVVLDDSLLDWVDPATERANLTGYSMFRVVLTYLQMNDEGDAQKAYGILQNQYPSGAVGQAYASMAQAFWDTYTETHDQVQGCLAARDFAEAHLDEILTPLYFGYANPAYTPADICSAEGP